MLEARMPESLPRRAPSNTLPRCTGRRKEEPREQSPARNGATPSRAFVRPPRARRVRFFRNGDAYYKGTWFPIASDRFRGIDKLMEELTRALGDLINLPHGVRCIFSIDGRQKIGALDELGDGESYVCASNESFKLIDYLSAKEPIWNYSNPRPSKSADSALVLDKCESGSEELATSEFIRPRIVTVIRHGVRPRKVVRLLLNRRTAPTYRQVLADVTNSVNLDSGVVRKIFTLNGKQVSTLAEFFGEDDVFIACGRERISIDDFYLASEEFSQLGGGGGGPRVGPRGIAGSSVRQSPRLPRRSQRMPTGELRRRVPRPSPLQARRFRSLRNEQKLSGRVEGRSASPIPEEDDVATPTADEPREEASEDEEDGHPAEIEERYSVGRLVGDGNFATVHEATDRETGGVVALKIIDKSRCQGKEDLVESEVRLLRRVDHPHIVRLFDVWDLPRHYYLAMEIVPGGDLFDALVRVKYFEEVEAAGLMGNLAGALDYLHGLDIVHRDVKPENLLLFRDSEGRSQLKLADFGLAAEATAPLFTVCGTPTYVCPEILQEDGYGVKVDVWAMGVILYIMLCGFPPFISVDNSQEELFEAILGGELSFPSPYWDPVSAAATGLVQGLLQSDPADRYSAAQVAVHPWITGDAADPAADDRTRPLSDAEFDLFGSRPSRSFFGAESVEFYSSRRRSMDDLRSESEISIRRH